MQASIRFPVGPKANQTALARLLAILGPRRFSALQRDFGGKRIWIPKFGARVSCKICVQRDACALLWRRQGRSVASIARHLGVSPKTVYRVLQEISRTGLRGRRLRRCPLGLSR